MNKYIYKIKAYYHAFKICFCPEMLWKDIRIKYYEFINAKLAIETAYWRDEFNRLKNS